MLKNPTEVNRVKSSSFDLLAKEVFLIYMEVKK